MGIHHTTATKSGFITTLYVVFVPLLEVVILRRNLPWLLWVCVITSFIGMAMIVKLGVSDFNYGDLLTLICAVVMAVQIYVLGQISPKVKTPFVFNLVQSALSALFCLPFAMNPEFFKKMAILPSQPMQIWIGLLSLSFGSTVIAFYLQVKAQRVLSPTVSSVLFLMESPFALLFANLLLGETLGLSEGIGALLILTAGIFASHMDVRRKQ
jgi:drug/metabolite transporter (DMT)-like permease